MAAMQAAVSAGLLAAEDAASLTAAWNLATQARNAVTLVRGKASDQLPTSGRDLVAVASLMGHEPGGDPGEFLEEYRRTTRRARAVAERVFYGEKP
jgi:[glutamine synthetase] adenylyltransferase / [glutamine synthetase]-adenylyl-L-tyrosine phosphorylase